MSDKQSVLKTNNLITPPDIQQRMLTAVNMIEKSQGEVGLDRIASALGISAYHFHRQFKKHVGVTPKQYAMAIRNRSIQNELHNAEQSITAAIYGAGFNSGGRFYAVSDSMLGMTPTAFRKGGDKVQIVFALAETSLGSLLVAKSEKGICSIALGDADELLQTFQSRFPNASLVANDEIFNQQVAMVVAMVETPTVAKVNLPLDIRGTAFQQKVWDALRKLSCGDRISYEELAQRIGMPKASRAVARACATNDLALAIPCHRVVRKNGDLSGYRWGVERKKILLERERSNKS